MKVIYDRSCIYISSFSFSTYNHSSLTFPLRIYIHRLSSMTTSTKKQHQLYAGYINPTIDQYSSDKENPLVLMAQACNNIGKELASLSPLSSKERKSFSPSEEKKSLKRPAPRDSLSPPPKKISIPQSSSSSFIFDSLFYQHWNKTLSSPTFDFSPLSTTTTSPLNYSAFSSTLPRSSYSMDSILSTPYVCNWFDSMYSDGFCGKRFTNHFHLFEHLCTEHSTVQSSYP